MRPPRLGSDRVGLRYGAQVWRSKPFWRSYGDVRGRAAGRTSDYRRWWLQTPGAELVPAERGQQGRLLALR
jgi:hypothetical protein